MSFSSSTGLDQLPKGALKAALHEGEGRSCEVLSGLGSRIYTTSLLLYSVGQSKSPASTDLSRQTLPVLEQLQRIYDRIHLLVGPYFHYL